MRLGSLLESSAEHRTSPVRSSPEMSFKQIGSDTTQYPVELFGPLSRPTRVKMQHFGTPIGRILAALPTSPSALQQVNKPDQGKAPLCRLPRPATHCRTHFPLAQEDNERDLPSGLRQAMRQPALESASRRHRRPIRVIRRPISAMDGRLGWSHAILDSSLINRLQLYRMKSIYYERTMGGRL